MGEVTTEESEAGLEGGHQAQGQEWPYTSPDMPSWSQGSQAEPMFGEWSIRAAFSMARTGNCYYFRGAKDKCYTRRFLLCQSEGKQIRFWDRASHRAQTEAGHVTAAQE